MVVVLFGNPVLGYKAFGPFDTIEAADKWGEDVGEGGDIPMVVHSPDIVGEVLQNWQDYD